MILCILSCLDSSGSVLVLDELDTGVGSRLGQTVGTLLQNICTTEGSPKNQVICVSHLPQVAASATHHIKAMKCLDQHNGVEIKFMVLHDTVDRSAEIKAMMGNSYTKKQGPCILLLLCAGSQDDSTSTFLNDGSFSSETHSDVEMNEINNM